MRVAVATTVVNVSQTNVLCYLRVRSGGMAISRYIRAAGACAARAAAAAAGGAAGWDAAEE